MHDLISKVWAVRLVFLVNEKPIEFNNGKKTGFHDFILPKFFDDSAALMRWVYALSPNNPSSPPVLVSGHLRDVRLGSPKLTHCSHLNLPESCHLLKRICIFDCCSETCSLDKFPGPLTLYQFLCLADGP